MSNTAVCRDFLRGACHREKCRYVHSYKRVCYGQRQEFSGWARKPLQSCRSFLLDGKCRFGERCRYNHPVSPLTLPDELLLEVVELLNVQELCTLSLVSKRFAELCKLDRRWHVLFTEKYGAPTKLTWKAAGCAGSWRDLYKAKAKVDRDAIPWSKPCQYELEAFSLLMTDGAFDVSSVSVPSTSGCSYSAVPLANDPCSPFLPPCDNPLASSASTSASPKADECRDLAVLFLLDGSGSLSEADFNAMRTFVKTAAAAMKTRCPRAKVGVLQFTTEVRVEVPPTEMDLSVLNASVDGMMRMSGGTNLATPIRQAETLLKEHAEADAARVVVLLSDGIVEPLHARDAAEKAAQLAVLLPNVTFYALGVGRDVDVYSMRTIIGEVAPAPPPPVEEPQWEQPQYNGTQFSANRAPRSRASSSTSATSALSSSSRCTYASSHPRPCSAAQRGAFAFTPRVQHLLISKHVQSTHLQTPNIQ